MHLTYENTNEEIIAVKRKPRHQPPHLHNAMEIVCVTKGTLELGVGQELYHMETGDIGVVFPDVIHHYQVFSSEVNEAVFINAPQMIFKNNTIPVKKHNNAINKIPSNGNLKIYLHESVKH